MKKPLKAKLFHIKYCKEVQGEEIFPFADVRITFVAKVSWPSPKAEQLAANI